MTVQLIRHTWKAAKKDNFGLGLAEQGQYLEQYGALQ